ncbi:adenylate/guanylate cyclase [Candidatus Koribacter versatilis Ellin345]|uniref:Adenylate/guanylate cyclase n=1 Tax=Koribacter versatilis (strain Ellin345) TaxID=204669 RepID=Q1IJR6_KORVE|nr:adenylate/guanylate cyclase domain-containing protein [Candidatus Koribacter versatilis]ABF42884.1 adenylate/guanylate cyclase [Candidatus Koribacter versatilis Ellin345]
MAAAPRKQSRAQRLFQRGAALAAVFTAVLLIGVENTKPMRWLETGTYDARMTWSLDPSRADKSIVILDIDNPSFEILKESFGRWPWTRMAWAGAIDYMADGHPKVIAFDFKFGGSEDPKVDQAFAESIRSGRNVLLGFSFDPAQIEDVSDVKNRKLALLARESLSDSHILGEHFPPADQSLNVPLDILAKASAGMGCLNAVYDDDGAVRRMPLGCNYGDLAFRTLDTRAVDYVRGHDASRFIRDGRYGDSTGERIPVDANGHLLVWFHGRPHGTYERVPFWKLVCSAAPDSCPNLKEPIPPSYFKDKIVLVGASASGSFELHSTPVGDAPGVFDRAAAIDNLLHGEGILIAPLWQHWILIAIMALVGWMVLTRLGVSVVGAPVMLSILGVYAVLAAAVFRVEHLWLPMVSPLSAGALAYISAGGVRYVTTGRELRATRHALERHMSPQLAQYALEHGDNLAGERRELTIFFSDIRSFTTLTESLRDHPDKLLALLNEYLTAMCEVIFKYEGVVDKFIGDGILAHWGAFTEGKNHALLAAQASLEMLDRLKQMNADWAAQGRDQLAIGIGLNTGEVTFGNVGAGQKTEFTVIGDPVNLASRLEGLNKEHHTSIIISEFTLEHLRGLVQTRELGGVKVKGKTIETQIYELQGLATSQEPVPAQTVGSRA